MSQFQKKYVRVEWLAVQKAIDLMREAGFDNSYFVSLSHLVGDEGTAPRIAEVGRELYDRDGHEVRIEELRAEDFGLEHEIGEFSTLQDGPGGVAYDERYFLKRTYEFRIFRQGEKTSLVSVWVSFAKRTKKDDWEVVHECVTDQRRNGNDRWVIYRTDDEEV